MNKSYACLQLRLYGCILFFVFTISLAAHGQNSSSKSGDPLPLRTINFNPLGFLQFGPILQLEYKVSKQGYFAPHVRLPYLGLLYHVINAEDRGTVTLSPAALGIGAGYKHFFPTEKGAWYAGGALEYSLGSSKGDDGKEWKSKFSNIALMSNGGFRWRFPQSKRSISVGAYAGLYSALSDNWWYVTTPSKKTDERSTSALVMLELSFGFEKK